ncbi:hypothetical protein LINPERHAP1_LOCUS19960, partial [Linum perenne]
WLRYQLRRLYSSQQRRPSPLCSPLHAPPFQSSVVNVLTQLAPLPTTTPTLNLPHHRATTLPPRCQMTPSNRVSQASASGTKAVQGRRRKCGRRGKELRIALHPTFLLSLLSDLEQIHSSTLRKNLTSQPGKGGERETTNTNTLSLAGLGNSFSLSPNGNPK